MDRPVPVFLVTLLFLVTLGLPFLHVRFNAPDASILPPFVPSRVAYDSLVADFPIGDFGPLALAIETDGPVTDRANVGLLYDYSRRIAADPRVERVDSIVDIDPRLDKAQYQLILSNPAGPAQPAASIGVVVPSSIAQLNAARPAFRILRVILCLAMHALETRRQGAVKG